MRTPTVLIAFFTLSVHTEPILVEAPSVPPKVHEQSVRSLLITPDGQMLVSSGGDHHIKIWSLKDGSLAATLAGQPAELYAFDASGQLARAESGGHSGPVHSLRVTPDGRILASASSDARVKLWSLPDGRLLSTLTDHKNLILDVAVSSGGKLLATAEDQSYIVLLWSLPDGKRVGEINNQGCVQSLAFSPDDELLAVGDCYQGLVRFWSAQDQQLVRTLGPFKSKVTGLRFSPEGDRLLIILRDEEPRLWSRTTGETQALDIPGALSVQDARFTADGTTLIAAGTGEGLNREGIRHPARVWIHSIKESLLTGVLESEQDFQWASVAVSPDGSLVAAGGYDGGIIVWRVSPPTYGFAIGSRSSPVTID